MTTVIIPIRNEEAFVALCLDSVLSQSASGVVREVLCVDGGSTDRTREIILDFAGRDSRVRLIDNPKKIVSTGLNEAIQNAQGNVIVRMDCHAQYPSDYVSNCLAVLERTGADNVGGYCDTVPHSDTSVSRAIAAALRSRFGVGGSVFRVGGKEEKEVDTVPFGCFRKQAFDRFGLYDERLVRNQDIELNSRIRALGGRIVISPTIHSTYYMRSTFAGLRQQAFNNGLWNPYTVYLTGGGLHIRHFVPLGLVLSLLVLASLGILWPPLLTVLMLEVLLYLLLGGAVSLLRARHVHASALLILASFIQLHAAYGIGSLVGALTAPFRFGFHLPSKGRPQTKQR